jgi:hypothetical protein
MSVFSADQGLAHFEDVTELTMAVAMVSRESIDFSHQPNILVQEGYDNLDYLSFALVKLPSGKEVALVHHKGAPVQGIEFCVVPTETHFLPIINETLKFLGLAPQELIWVHPQVVSSYPLTHTDGPNP